MTEGVVELRPGASQSLRIKERVDPASVIHGAGEAGLVQVAIVGRTASGELYVAGSDCGDISMGLLMRAVTRLSMAEDLGMFDSDEP